MNMHSKMEPSFDAIFEFTTMGMALISLEGQWLKINSSLSRIIGYSEQELLTKPIKTIFENNLAPHIEDTFEKLIVGELQSFQANIHLIHKDSSLLSVDWLISVVRNATNEAYAFIVQVKDLSKQSEMKRKLAESEQRYKSLIEHNPAGIITCDRRGSILQVNPAMERILGYSEKELICQNIDHVFKQDHRGNVLSGKIISQHDNYMIGFIHKNGDLIDLGVKNVPIIVNDHLDGVYLIAKDITQFNKDRESLRATKELLESVINNTSDAIYVLDLNERVISVNAAHEHIFGWSQEELKDKHLPIYPDHLEDERNEMYDKLRLGKQISGKESIRLRKDGQLIHVSMTETPIKNEKGEIFGFAGITRDITERKQTEELLRKSDKLSVAGQLAAGLAHEIRNPLTSLRGFLQLLQHDLKGKQHYFDIMLSELDRINFIVSEFLVIAKPEAITYKKSDLSEILQSVIALLDSQAVLCNVQLLLEFQSEIPEIVCSEMHLKQLFINLVKNAMEAIPKDGQIKIIVSLQRDEQIRVRTQDNGCGIPEERLKQLGEPFYTTKEKGTGLGLMMCFKIVEAHKGSMNIQSQVGYGTTIDVFLPTHSDEQQRV